MNKVKNGLVKDKIDLELLCRSWNDKALSQVEKWGILTLSCWQAWVFAIHVPRLYRRLSVTCFPMREHLGKHEPQALKKFDAESESLQEDTYG